jgi:catechol 2,3-dioxygenase-like lactoylglutathione lyase family enzyme
MSMSLKDGRVATRIPVRDLKRARAFYADKLGLEPTEEHPGGLLYRFASSRCSSRRAPEHSGSGSPFAERPAGVRR